MTQTAVEKSGEFDDQEDSFSLTLARLRDAQIRMETLGLDSVEIDAESFNVIMGLVDEFPRSVETIAELKINEASSVHKIEEQKRIINVLKGGLLAVCTQLDNHSASGIRAAVHQALNHDKGEQLDRAARLDPEHDSAVRASD